MFVRLGVILGRDPDICREPNLAFVSVKRGEQLDSARWADAVPELVVEIVSPSNRPEQMKRKVRQYLNAGTEVVWVVYPKSRTVRVQRFVGKNAVAQYHGHAQRTRIPARI